MRRHYGLRLLLAIAMVCTVVAAPLAAGAYSSQARENEWTADDMLVMRMHQATMDPLLVSDLLDDLSESGLTGESR